MHVLSYTFSILSDFFKPAPVNPATSISSWIYHEMGPRQHQLFYHVNLAFVLRLWPHLSRNKLSKCVYVDVLYPMASACTICAVYIADMHDMHGLGCRLHNTMCSSTEHDCVLLVKYIYMYTAAEFVTPAPSPIRHVSAKRMLPDWSGLWLY